MNKTLAASTALVLALGGVALTATSAQATHPQVSGVAVCDTTTGDNVITWTVSGDPGYPDVAGTFTSASRVADQIVGKTVTGGQTVTATERLQPNVRSLELTVGIQFANHSRGDIVTNHGSVRLVDCVRTLEGPAGLVSFTDATCDAGINSAVVTLEGLTTASYTLNGGAAVPVAAGSYSGFEPGAYVVTLTGENGQVLNFEHTFVAPPEDAACAPAQPEPVRETKTVVSVDCVGIATEQDYERFARWVLNGRLWEQQAFGEWSPTGEPRTRPVVEGDPTGTFNGANCAVAPEPRHTGDSGEVKDCTTGRATGETREFVIDPIYDTLTNTYGEAEPRLVSTTPTDRELTAAEKAGCPVVVASLPDGTKLVTTGSDVLWDLAPWAVAAAALGIFLATFAGLRARKDRA